MEDSSNGRVYYCTEVCRAKISLVISLEHLKSPALLSIQIIIPIQSGLLSG